jgi:predicted transglutaminase-like cysteine proteinase
MTPQELEEKMQYWDSKYPKIRKMHEGRLATGLLQSAAIVADVRSFLRYDDWGIVQLLETQVFKRPLKEIVTLTDDEKVGKCQDWVMSHIEYVSDNKSWGKREFWQFPCETMALKTGDCEDGCFLLHSMLLNANVDWMRLRSTAGWVMSNNGERGGHMYLTYCRGEDWVIIDWCYHPETWRMDMRTPVKECSKYLDVWFSFNNWFCYSHEDIPVMYGRVNKAKRRFSYYD